MFLHLFLEKLKKKYFNKMKPLNLIYVTIFLTFGFTTAANAQSSNNHNSLELNNDKSSSATGAKCREGCLEKVIII